MAAKRARTMTPAEAREAGMDALLFLASEPDRMAGFLIATGATPAELRASARSESTLRAALVHLEGDESLLLVFAADTHRAPEDIARARAALEGHETDV